MRSVQNASLLLEMAVKENGDIEKALYKLLSELKIITDGLVVIERTETNEAKIMLNDSDHAKIEAFLRELYYCLRILRLNYNN